MFHIREVFFEAGVKGASSFADAESSVLKLIQIIDAHVVASGILDTGR